MLLSRRPNFFGSRENFMSDETKSNEEERDETVADETEASSEDGREEAAARVGVKFSTEDRWEAWSYASVGLTIAAAIALIVAFLRLGYYSVFAYQDILLYCGWGTVLLSFWGLIRTFFNPPVLRRSRTIAFGLLLVTGYATLSRPFSPPLLTEGWESDTDIRLPFEGEMMTLAGGDKHATNYYNRLPAMRWAYAWGPVEEGKTFENDGKRVEDYYCWGETVVAPVGGEVVSYENGVVDIGLENSPTGNLLGNHVGIEFGESEYLFVSNMMEKSITVRPGDIVDKGDPIGECGRSGYSPEPLVVMHGQNSLTFPISESLPIKISNYRIGEKTVDQGMPRGTSIWQGKLNGTVVAPAETSE